MKIFLQHKRTLLFLEKLTAWTSSPDDAMDFKQARVAMDFANHYAIGDVRILVVAPTSAGRVEVLPFEIPATAMAQ